MGLRLADKWLWDFWLAQAGPDYHLFYLQAPRALGDPEHRHWHVSVGHAISHDLRRWEVLPDALAPGPAGAWDDYTTWTGSVFPDDGGWAMLYTGTSRSEGGLVQRVGLARSEDLVTWRRHPGNPVLAADHRLYEALDREAWHEEAWRDPWVFRHPRSGVLHALVTARSRAGDPAGRGVIGLARASSPADWEVLPPITRPGAHGHMEVPQLVGLGGRWHLLYSVPARSPGAGTAWAGAPPTASLAGTHLLSADDPLGPFEWETHAVLLADRVGTWYGAKLIEAPDGSLACLAWLNCDADGRFVGELAAPMAVEVGPMGPRAILD